MYSCPTLEKSAVQPKTTSLCSSITVITLWDYVTRVLRSRWSRKFLRPRPGAEAKMIVSINIYCGQFEDARMKKNFH